MKEYCYVIVNNAGHSWSTLSTAESNGQREPGLPILPQLLQEGWEPVRETPMGGGSSQLAHSLILLQRTPAAKPVKATRGTKQKE
jgi:hypothetical protein